VRDEEGALAALKAIRRELGAPKIAKHRGRCRSNSVQVRPQAAE